MLVRKKPCKALLRLYKSFNNHVNGHQRRSEFVIDTQDTNSSEPIDLPLQSDISKNTDLPLESNTSDGIDLPLNSVITDSKNPYSPISLEESQVLVQPNTSEDRKSASQVLELNSIIEKMETLFALKITSKHLLSRDVVNEIMDFSNQIHSIKVKCITSQLRANFGSDESVEISKVIDTIDLCDNVIGLKDILLTEYKRNRHLKNNYRFIEPLRTVIKREEDIELEIDQELPTEEHFFYRLPIQETLKRMLSDDSLRP